MAFLPELILCGTIVLLLFVRLFRASDRGHLGWVALVVDALIALLVSWNQWNHVEGYDPRSDREPAAQSFQRHVGLR